MFISLSSYFGKPFLQSSVILSLRNQMVEEQWRMTYVMILLIMTYVMIMLISIYVMDMEIEYIYDD